MKNKKLLSIILILLLLLNSIGCGKKAKPTLITDDYNSIDLNEINNYEIQVAFNPNNKFYSANQKTIYINNTGEDLKEIYFHLYPRAYNSIKTAPILFESQELKKSYITGNMEIKTLKINKADVDFKIGGVTDTILKIPINSPIKPGEKVEIYMEYSVKLPQNIDRFGFGEDIFNFGNWYPILAVYDEKGWNLDPYYSLGDPFYSDIANYQVEITTPKDIIVASSGNILSEKTKGDKKTYTIEGKLIRDFAWVASPNFKIKEIEAEDTTIKLYSLEDNLQMENFALKVGKDSIEIFNGIFGEYPYGQYSIVMTEFPTGMEYPGLVFIGKDFFQENYKDSLEIVIVHETAHQWWYGVVGNDQIDEAWLDEALATYSEVIYMGEKYGEEVGRNYYDYSLETSYEYGKDIIDKDRKVVKPLGEFGGWDDYGLLVYTKGAMFIGEIEKDFGREILYNILNKYYNKYKFHIAKTEDFIKICENTTATSFKERVDKWLYGK
ncbi:MAG: M1 family metallopeptidase [Tissierellia bacterium]|nr:M1 family metallopeptidase [Tissierellia bacterium]